MRDKIDDALGRYVVARLDEHNAHYIRNGMQVRISNGGGWDHVSVSFKTWCPTWEEMCQVKRWCFRDDEAVMQLHPPKSDYRDAHPFCLHLWRPQTTAEIAEIKAQWLAGGDEWPDEYPTVGCEIPLPPGSMVAPESSIKS